jgi:hypothetical protein
VNSRKGVNALVRQRRKHISILIDKLNKVATLPHIDRIPKLPRGNGVYRTIYLARYRSRGRVRTQPVMCRIDLTPEWELLKAAHAVALKTYTERNTLDAWLNTQVDELLQRPLFNSLT